MRLVEGKVSTILPTVYSINYETNLPGKMSPFLEQWYTCYRVANYFFLIGFEGHFTGGNLPGTINPVNSLCLGRPKGKENLTTVVKVNCYTVKLSSKYQCLIP